jgi:hypothetical protein
MSRRKRFHKPYKKRRRFHKAKKLTKYGSSRGGIRL